MAEAVHQPPRQMTATINSYLGYMRHLNCRNFTRRLIERHPEFHEKGRFTLNYLKFVPYRKLLTAPPPPELLRGLDGLPEVEPPPGVLIPSPPFTRQTPTAFFPDSVPQGSGPPRKEGFGVPDEAADDAPS